MSILYDLFLTVLLLNQDCTVLFKIKSNLAVPWSNSVVVDDAKKMSHVDSLKQILIDKQAKYSIYVGTVMGPFKYYVSRFLAFFHPTHPPCNRT